MDGRSDMDTEMTQAVQRYVAMQARRYVPVVLALVLVAAMIARAPSVTERDKASNLPTGPGGAASGQGDGTGSAEAAAAPGEGQPGAAGPGGAGPGEAGQGGAGASVVGGGGAAGVARTGVTCGPGVRQFPWSKYAPPCIPAFGGSNGAATSPGVTKDTIVVTYRRQNSASSSAINAASPNTFTPDPQFIADMQRYIDLFNKSFELYGRKVVLKPFDGQSDYLLEVQGQNQGQAQSDAVEAKDLGAFADMSLNTASQIYQEALIQQKVMAFGGVYMSQKWFTDHAPYAFASFFPTGTKAADAVVNLVCQRLSGLPAIDAGDPAMHIKQRVFGVITPENPVYDDAGDRIEAGLAKCGVKVAKSIRYALNIATAQQQSTSIVAQMKAAGVTTVLCGCDPIVPVFLAQAANQQQYRPEWDTLWWGDVSSRSVDASQWSHSFSIGVSGQIPPKANLEAYQVIKRAGAEPAEINYPLAYYSLLQLFMGLHATGPNLTPQNFQRGLFSLPRTASGDFGAWSFGDGAWTPPTEYVVAYWDPNAPSNFDGAKGAYVNCEGGKRFPFADGQALGPRGQLTCFGR